MIEDKMRAVTVCAYSAWEQSFFSQAFSMNAAGIVHNHISHLGFQSGGVAYFSVTASTELGTVGAVGFFLIVQMRLYGMCAVAVRTVGRIRVFLHVGFAVPALQIVFGDLGMAVGTIHMLCGLTGPVDPRGYIHVTFYTGSVLVHGILDDLLVDGKGDGLPIDDLVHVLLFMALQALPVCCSHYHRRLPYAVGLMAHGAGRNRTGFLLP